jgi:hypothetical protein
MGVFHAFLFLAFEDLVCSAVTREPINNTPPCEIIVFHEDAKETCVLPQARP